MKKVEAIIRSDRLGGVRENLQRAEDDLMKAIGMTVSDVGHAQREIPFADGAGYSQVDFSPKTKIEIVVEDWDVEAVVEAIREGAKTGKYGDGKVFVSPIGNAIAI